ncbi:MAG TPA: hypothetical protein VET23_03690 [Chitinophagaceae bacterium]|nr:hypothetical protein [Chitinophagaceae bacterium]
MLITLLACFYITLICRGWGLLVLQSLKKKFKDETFSLPHFSIVCFVGLAAITVFAGFLSLLMPLGGWLAQVLIIIPGLFLFFRNRQSSLFLKLKKYLNELHPALLFLFISCIVMILLMSTWMITHPDTLGYHAQTIQWIEKHKAVPGIVQLHVRYGYQGLWYVACAVFSFRFAGIESVTYLNFSVLIWYFLFITSMLYKYLYKVSDFKKGLLWLLLFVISIWSYTQVRLTASSASPDFITALLLWLIFYFLSTNGININSTVRWVLIIFLCVFAVCIKLSAFPVIIIALYAFFQSLRLKKMKPLFFAFAIAAITFSPFVARNIISSGYIAFPSTFPDVVNADWKYNKELTAIEKNYISAYAKGYRDGSRKEVAANASQNISQWLPLWWDTLSISDKSIISFLLLSLLLAITAIKQILRSDLRLKIILLCELAGIVFWFVQAPDPRFGFGFLIAFPATVFNNYYSSKYFLQFSLFKKIITPLIIGIGLFVSAYSIYRVINFFSVKQVMCPMGIEAVPYTKIKCDNIEFNLPVKNNPCGNTAIPCVYNSCENFQPRGSKIEDGFKAR